MTTPPTMRTLLPDARQSPRFAGIATFCRLPRLEDVPRERLPLDWIVYGVPFDGGVTFRPGARFGPRAIREASQYIKPYNPALDVNIAQALSLADGGDAPVQPFDCKANADAACSFAEALGDPRRTRLLAVGGDHSIAYANIRATWLRRGRPKGGLALLHFDAHLDTVDSVWGERWSHASPFIRAIEDGLIDPTRMLSVGIHGPMNSAADLDFAYDRGVQVVTYDEWRSGDGRARIKQFLTRLAAEEAYLSLDIDCVDPAYAPGTGTPVCGGFTAAELLDLLRQCSGANLIGADVVEVLPDRDPAGITAMLAAQAVFELLSIGALAGLSEGR
jgi:agmatinase